MLMLQPKRAGLLVLLATGLLAAACGSTVASGAGLGGADQSARQTCESTGVSFAARFGSVRAVVGAFDVTAADIVYWQENRHGSNGPRPTSRWRARGGDTDAVIVCYFDGSYAGFPTDPAGMTPPPPYDRLVVLIDKSGTAEVEAVGHQSRLGIVRPARPTP
jgi:hypothetical protein